MKGDPQISTLTVREFGELYERFEPDLRRFIRSLLPPQADAEEVLQNTSVVLLRKMGHFSSSSDPDDRSFLRWACVIAKYEVLSYRKKKAKEKLVFSGELLDMMADESMDEQSTREREHAALQECLLQLPAGQAKMIREAYAQGVKGTELAKDLGISAETFYMRMNRMRKKLLACVQERLMSGSE